MEQMGAEVKTCLRQAFLSCAGTLPGSSSRLFCATGSRPGFDTRPPAIASPKRQSMVTWLRAERDFQSHVFVCVSRHGRGNAMQASHL